MMINEMIFLFLLMSKYFRDPDKMRIQIEIFSYFSVKKYAVGTQLRCF